MLKAPFVEFNGPNNTRVCFDRTTVKGVFEMGPGKTGVVFSEKGDYYTVMTPYYEVLLRLGLVAMPTDGGS